MLNSTAKHHKLALNLWIWEVFAMFFDSSIEGVSLYGVFPEFDASLLLISTMCWNLSWHSSGRPLCHCFKSCPSPFLQFHTLWFLVNTQNVYFLLVLDSVQFLRNFQWNSARLFMLDLQGLRNDRCHLRDHLFVSCCMCVHALVDQWPLTISSFWGKQSSVCVSL